MFTSSSLIPRPYLPPLVALIPNSGFVISAIIYLGVMCTQRRRQILGTLSLSQRTSHLPSKNSIVENLKNAVTTLSYCSIRDNLVFNVVTPLM